jgi:hypothetical protein
MIDNKDDVVLAAAAVAAAVYLLHKCLLWI